MKQQAVNVKNIKLPEKFYYFRIRHCCESQVTFFRKCKIKILSSSHFSQKKNWINYRNIDTFNIHFFVIVVTNESYRSDHFYSL